jgi:ubiquinone/menaquinone biosynthesis C-methylase UbiE
MNPTKQNYTPGHCPTATAYMADRDLESHGFFLQPLLQPGFHVLDVGCGPATITMGIADAVMPGRVTGVDLESAPLEKARRRAEGCEIVNLDFVTGASHQLPFADETFDVVFAHALLEHLGDPIRTLREFHRVTRPGGFVAICCPDWDAFEYYPHTQRLARAIGAYRTLQEHNGGNTRAGARLGEWLQATGFTPLVHDEWQEEYDNTQRIADFLALQLDQAGQFHHAASLRDWAKEPGASFRQSWKYATAVRADDYKRSTAVIE